LQFPINGMPGIPPTGQVGGAGEIPG